MLIDTFKWRKEFDMESLTSETFDEDIFGKIGYIAGHDKEGRPVTVFVAYSYNLYGGQDMKPVCSRRPSVTQCAHKISARVRWRVQLMERSVEALDFENIDQMIQVHGMLIVVSSLNFR